MVTIRNPGKPINPGDIEQLEFEIGRPLPSAYRAFLLSYNGGQPKPNIIDIEGASFKGADVHVLHGIEDEIASCDLRWNWENLDGCKENLLLPIAHDSGAHTFALVLDEENYGHVYYFDSDEEPPRPYHLAADFNTFLGLLRDWTPEELADIADAARGPDEP